MNHKLSILVTGDGSTTILNSDLNETYHSINGATVEAEHVYISGGLNYFVNKTKLKEVKIFEVGFGTGLNACLSYQYAHAHALRINYTTIEAFPLPPIIIQQLNFPSLDKIKLESIHQAGWNSVVTLDDHFTIGKFEQHLLDFNLPEKCTDIIYFDAFAPSKQPDMWVPEILAKMYNALTQSGVLVTYCARGQFQRDLRSAGFSVERLPGPPGKRQMIRATKH
jgi:tRNA U34 5-methylaminomethyl-2-thiouridine-forming methyltransferase MnmC